MQALPAFCPEIVDMDVLPGPHVGNEPADILAVFDRRIAGLQVFQGHLVTDRDVIGADQAEGRIVVGDDAEHVRSGLQAFDDNNADIVLVIMDEQLGDRHRALLNTASFAPGLSSTFTLC
jgi:hypothetical protein